MGARTGTSRRGNGGRDRRPARGAPVLSPAGPTRVIGGVLMQRHQWLAVAAFAALAALPPGTAGAQTTLNVVTAGDQNMVDYVNNYLAPRFEKMNPGVKVRAVGTGPGDAGSQKIYEKLSAQQKAGNSTWDVDVAVIHQRGAATMVKEIRWSRNGTDTPRGSLVPRDTPKIAPGGNVDA